MNRSLPISCALGLMLLLAAAGPADAGNIDLSTIPSRKSVQLTIYNSEDITLVRETRLVTFKKGSNPLQFSWAGTLIDPTSVQLRFLTHADELELLDTTFPHAKPQMLYWNVSSEFDGAATIEITYFTSGIRWSADYQCIANADETQMNFEGFVRVFNNSGEEYDDAEIRLVVGTINLVEKIAQLAQVSREELERLGEDRKRELAKDATHYFFSRRDAPASSGSLTPELKAKEIIKEGLSEYFIYTVEGTESISNGWSKRMRSFEGQTVPFKIEYRFRPAEYGEQLVRMYLLTNDEASKLGTTPLPDGIVRVFRNNGRDGLSYLAQQTIKYVPIGDKIELNLGVDPEVVFELIKLRVRRDNLWLKVNGKNTYRKVGNAGVVVEQNSAIDGWDDHEIYTQRIRNYTPQPIRVEVRRTYPGDVTFRSQLEPKLHDYQTVEFRSTVPAGKTSDLSLEVVRHQGYNAKQNNVKLETAEVHP
jgi:hypothetical protein